MGVSLGIDTGVVVVGDRCEPPVLGALSLVTRLKDVAGPNAVVI